MSRPRLVAAALFLVLFGALTVPMALWPVTRAWLGLVSYGLYVLLAAGLAASLVEAVLGLLWPPCEVALVKGPASATATR